MNRLTPSMCQVPSGWAMALVRPAPTSESASGSISTIDEAQLRCAPEAFSEPGSVSVQAGPGGLRRAAFPSMPRPLLAVRGAAEFAEADFVPARTEPGPVGGFERFGQVNGMGIRVESRRVANHAKTAKLPGPAVISSYLQRIR